MKNLPTEIPSNAKKSLADLHQLFPERSLMLVTALRERNKEGKKLPEWRSEQIAKLTITVIESAMDLEPAYLCGRISALAWATRNLLELSIWIDYCNLSDQHAKRFSDDSLRDLYGLSKAVKTTLEAEAGITSSELDVALSNLSQFAQQWGIASLEDDFKRVSDAAKELGRGAGFQAANKLLSKFAHPTAWSVHIADNPGPEAGYLTMILQDGVFLALNAIITTRKTIRTYYPEIAPSREKSRSPR
jgi:hypothetical protein